jgi:hypothetical protein
MAYPIPRGCAKWRPLRRCSNLAGLSSTARQDFCAMFKTYMDETGIHDDADMVAVGCYIAKPKVWRDWTKKWNVAKAPIGVFHSTDCANFQGEFRGWDKDRRDPYVAKLLPAIAEHDLAGMVIGVQLKDLAEALKDRPELMEMFGEPYTACFQWAVSTIMELANKHSRGTRMAFVHEVNDFKGEAMKAFQYVRDNLNPRGIKMTLRFGSKADYSPLQAADVLAYEGGKFLKNPNGVPRRAWTALDPDKSRIIAKRYGKENMPELIKLLSDFREKLLEQGWDGKVAA